KDHAANLEFEEAARLRDELRRLEAEDLGLSPSGSLTQRAERARALLDRTGGRPAGEKRTKTRGKGRRGR
ncbi:MAG: UvrB/UvrC motif-containing protein, partial [Bauldia litoralis]